VNKRDKRRGDPEDKTHLPATIEEAVDHSRDNSELAALLQPMRQYPRGQATFYIKK